MTAAERPAFDARALTDPVDAAAVRTFTTEHRIAGISTARWRVIVAAATAISLGLAGTVVWLSVRKFGGDDGSESIHWSGILGLAGVLVLVLLVGRGWISNLRRTETSYRLAAFATANDMTYKPRVARPARPGLIFAEGTDRESSDVLRTRGEMPVEYGNYRYRHSDSRRSDTYTWGYVGIRVGTPLPHILLDAKGNNSVLGTNLPSHFYGAQTLALEGDFNKHFQLYCPEGYEKDALYLFTPDIMARFIDRAAQCDVEIVDDWVFLYLSRDVCTTDPQMWQWLFTTVHELREKFAQWQRWRDQSLEEQEAERSGKPIGTFAPPPGVATPGKRLRKTLNWPIVIGVGVWITWGVVQTIIDTVTRR